MTAEPTAPYRVLARKYRPTTLAGLVGQDVLVRTLTNAFQSGRIAQAYLLTGVRGVGKTTTARLIARMLNCEKGPTPEPCGACVQCVAILEDRHVDVLEMDAASRTGIEDVRELIDGARYVPTTARYKVYIIDEIHMLSEKAFNALLKTLEEPPPHVKFVFATTEVRKVPVTIVSRCQRFDLRRIDADRLVEHFAGIVAAEGVTVSPEALRLVARAADGSVRDGLSLLDQAIAHGDGAVDEALVKGMLGLADRTAVFDLFERVMAGDLKGALDEFKRQHDAGVDPGVVLSDLLELVHWLTRVKVAPELAQGAAVAEAERQRGAALAQRLAMPALARAWQMLLKGHGETRVAPAPRAAAEMVLVRLAHVADLPPPGELVAALAGEGPAAATRGASAPAGAGPRAESPPWAPAEPRQSIATQPRAELAQPRAEAGPAAPRSFAEVAALAETRKEPMLAAHLRRNVRPVRFAEGQIEISPLEAAPASLATDLAARLLAWTGRPWKVALVAQSDAPTLREQAERDEIERRRKAAQDPVVGAVLQAFPGARITAIRPRGSPKPSNGDEGP